MSLMKIFAVIACGGAVAVFAAEGLAMLVAQWALVG
jgi:hypothetical protein